MTQAYQHRQQTLETLAAMSDWHNIKPVSQRDFVSLATIISRHARRVDRDNLAACNGINRYDEKARMVLPSWTDSDEEKRQRARDKARLAIAAAFADTFKDMPYVDVFKVELQGDPRGAAIILAIREEGQPLREWRF